MLTRVLTGVIGAILAIFVVILGNPIFKYALLAISLIGAYEFYNATKNESVHPQKPIPIIGYIAIIVIYIFTGFIEPRFDMFMAAVVIVSMIIMVLAYPKYSIIDIVLTIFPIVYVGLFFVYIAQLRDMNLGVFGIGMIAISAWGSDTCAYFTGRAIGKHKLAPVLSPKKTIEGSIGGIIGAAILTTLFAVVYTNFEGQEAILDGKLIWVIVISMIAALISQFGDLAASAIKRYFNQKDYGNLLPGHGGILDRFDSVLFVVPIVYIALRFLEGV